MEHNSNMNMISETSYPNEADGDQKMEFFERPFEEVEGGYHDERTFYTTPNGSFWDEDGQYFNHLGFDKHGGTYDKYGVYIPGEGWNEELNCYNDEINKENITEKICSQVMDNINKELVEDYEMNEKALKNQNQDFEGEENEEDEPEELSEAQMKEIFDEAIQNQNLKKGAKTDEEKMLSDFKGNDGIKGFDDGINKGENNNINMIGNNME